MINSLSRMLPDYSVSLDVFDGNLKHKNYWIYGPTGCGKTRWIYSQSPVNEVYCVNDVFPWWDGFDPEETNVVYMEMPNNRLSKKMKERLFLCSDIYPFDGKVKYSKVCICPSKFFFIVEAYYPIRHYFGNVDEVNKLKSRFTEINLESDQEFLNTKLDKTILH